MHQLVDDSELQRLLGADVLPREDHVEPVREPDLARKSLGAARPGDQSQLHLGKAEDRFRMIGRDAVATGKGRLESPAEAGAMDGGDDWNPESLERVEEKIQTRLSEAKARGELREATPEGAESELREAVSMAQADARLEELKKELGLA